MASSMMKICTVYVYGFCVVLSLSMLCAFIYMMKYTMFDMIPMDLAVGVGKVWKSREDLDVVYDDQVPLLSDTSPVWDGADLDGLSTMRTLCSGKMSAVSKSFHPALNVDKRKSMKTLVSALSHILDINNMTYFLYSGSLIGSFRHHGMVPWDDDFDIAVHNKHKEQLKTVLTNTSQSFKGHTKGVRWKFFFADKTIINPEIAPWSFPFIDISFFVVTATSVQDEDLPWARQGFRYKHSDVFPLIHRPFWDMWLPVPKNTDTVLRETYKLDDCVSPSYSHEREVYLPKNCHLLCSALTSFFPFVERTRKNNSIVENLVFNNTVIQTVVSSLVGTHSVLKPPK